MEVTNILKEPQKPNPALDFARWAAVWVVVYVAFGAYGGIFTSAPQAMPAGMTWVNSSDALSSTFYILRGGTHLVLELNRHSQMFWAVLFTVFPVVCMYACSQGVQGKLKNKKGELLPRYAQVLIALLVALMAAFFLGYAGWRLLQKETVDLDPVADSVMLNGERIGAFRDVTHFRPYISPLHKGTMNYFINIEFRDRPDIQIGGGNAQGDVQQVADYLNTYLAEVRQ